MCAEEKNQEVVKFGNKKTGWSSDDNLCSPALEQNVLQINRHLLHPNM